MPDAMARRAAYAEAGANGFFVPGLTDAALIEGLCSNSPLPINVMMTGDLTSISAVSAMRVARASYGPVPYFTAMSDLADHQEKTLRS